MKLIKALELADECGLETVMEAFRNVQLHAPQLFVFEHIDSEYRELMDDWYSIRDEYNSFDWDSSVKEVLERIKNE